MIHSGIYYAPGSLKADLCRRGAERTKEFAQAHGIPYAVPGSSSSPLTPTSSTSMANLYERSRHNQLAVTRIGAQELTELEPNIIGLGALLVPSTGIIDYGAVTRALADDLRAAGGEVVTGDQVIAIRESADAVQVETRGRQWSADRLVACAGVQADRVAALAGVQSDVRMVPFRGEYYRLPEGRNELVERLIYPVPDPDLPFLGVHISPTIGGRLTLGPNAVLGLAREGYRKGSWNTADVRDLVAFPGLWHLARHHVRVGAHELWRSLSRRSYLKAGRKYCPSLELSDLLPQEAGIRAQAVARDGHLLHDFHFEHTPRSVHVLNAPSPAATSALPIGDLIAERLLRPRGLTRPVLGAPRPVRAPRGSTSGYGDGMASPSPATEVEVGDRTVRVTNPDRVYFPARGETKLDLVNYYLSVGDGIVNALRERPCMMHRFPTGVSGEKVHQKRLPHGAPPWVETVRVTFPRYNRTADELCVTELGPRDLGGADVDGRVPPVELPAGRHREAGRVADRPRPDAGLRLRPGTPGRPRRARGARRARRGRLAEDLWWQRDAHLRADRPDVRVQRRPSRRAGVRARGGAPGSR